MLRLGRGLGFRHLRSSAAPGRSPARQLARAAASWRGGHGRRVSAGSAASYSGGHFTTPCGTAKQVWVLGAVHAKLCMPKTSSNTLSLFRVPHLLLLGESVVRVVALVQLVIAHVAPVTTRPAHRVSSAPRESAYYRV